MKKLTKKKQQEIRHLIAMISAVALIIILLLTGGLTVYQNIVESVPVKSRTQTKYNVPKPEITEKLLTQNVNSRPGITLEQVNGVVIHYTANPGTDAMANRNYFESRKNMAESIENKVSSHFIIGLDGTIIQCIPLTEISYASNERNKDTISIECCHPDQSGVFSEETKTALIQLTAWLCGEYHLNQDDIIRHYDVTGKLCPKYYVKHPKKWKALKEEIYNEMLKYREE